MREKMLAEYLKNYKDCIVEFGEEYTQDVLIADLNKRLDEINPSNWRRRDIYLTREKRMNGNIVFVFKSYVSHDTRSAIMVLSPVRRWVAGSSSNGKSDAE